MMVKLFSIRQPFSERIFKNEKLVEFRRQNVRVEKNETCIIYTSSPIKKITGYFIVKEKIRLPIKKLWEKTKGWAGITKKEFIGYFKGCKEGTAILFKFVKKFRKAIRIDQIKNKLKGFRPPQSYYSIDKSFLKRLKILNQIKFLDPI